MRLVSPYFKALKTPHAFVVDKAGDVVYQGGVTNSISPDKDSKFYLKEVLSSLSSTNKSPYEYKRALGCYIKR